MNSNSSSGIAPDSSATSALPGGQESVTACRDLPEGVPDTAADSEKATAAAALDLVRDIPVRLSVELGRTEIPIRDIANLGRGSLIELDGSPGEPLDVRVNGVLIGRGEVVVINEERLGLRFIEVVSQTERVKRAK